MDSILGFLKTTVEFLLIIGIALPFILVIGLFWKMTASDSQKKKDAETGTSN